MSTNDITSLDTTILDIRYADRIVAMIRYYLNDHTRFVSWFHIPAKTWHESNEVMSSMPHVHQDIKTIGDLQKLEKDPMWRGESVITDSSIKNEMRWWTTEIQPLSSFTPIPAGHNVLTDATMKLILDRLIGIMTINPLPDEAKAEIGPSTNRTDIS